MSNITTLIVERLETVIAAIVPTEHPGVPFRLAAQVKLEGAELPDAMRLFQVGYAAEQHLEPLSGITEAGELHRVLEVSVVYEVPNRDWRAANLLMASDADDICLALIQLSTFEGNPPAGQATNGVAFAIDPLTLQNFTIGDASAQALMVLTYTVKYRRS